MMEPLRKTSTTATTTPAASKASAMFMVTLPDYEAFLLVRRMRPGRERRNDQNHDVGGARRRHPTLPVVGAILGATLVVTRFARTACSDRIAKTVSCRDLG